MVGAGRFRLLVKVLDFPHSPMASDPQNRSGMRAGRVLLLPGPMGDGKGPERFAGAKPVHLIGSEPASQRVIEIVLLARTKQKIVPELAPQARAARVPIAAISVFALMLFGPETKGTKMVADIQLV